MIKLIAVEIGIRKLIQYQSNNEQLGFGFLGHHHDRIMDDFGTGTLGVLAVLKLYQEYVNGNLDQKDVIDCLILQI